MAKAGLSPSSHSAPSTARCADGTRLTGIHGGLYSDQVNPSARAPAIRVFGLLWAD